MRVQSLTSANLTLNIDRMLRFTKSPKPSSHGNAIDSTHKILSETLWMRSFCGENFDMRITREKNNINQPKKKKNHTQRDRYTHTKATVHFLLVCNFIIDVNRIFLCFCPNDVICTLHIIFMCVILWPKWIFRPILCLAVESTHMQTPTWNWTLFLFLTPRNRNESECL